MRLQMLLECNHSNSMHMEYVAEREERMETLEDAMANRGGREANSDLEGHKVSYTDEET